MPTECEEQGVVDVGGDPVQYALRVVDARPAQQQEQDARRGRPKGNVIVLVPGHGQGVHGPKKLAATAARVSRSKLVWCIDPVPASGGDHVEGQAIARIVTEKISAAFPAARSPVAATLVGWSHGASEALRAADHAPELFPQFLGLCPLGLVEKRPLRLLCDFIGEAARILRASVRRRDWVCLKDTLRLGANAAAGLVRDMARTRSARRLIEDVDWAGRKVSGSELAYPGDVVLLFGRQDTVVRWQDVLPGCTRPEEIATVLATYGGQAFPRARHVEVQVVEGAHVAPETDAPAVLQTGLGLLGQLEVGTAE